MKILVITRNAWDDTNAIGNTITNFFSGIEDTEFASIYFRATTPNNKLCDNYFQTSEIEVLKKWFNAKEIGNHFYLDADTRLSQETKVARNEKKFIRVIQKYGIKLAYKLSDYVWYSEKWMNSNLKEFIDTFAPDLVFTFVKSAPQYYLSVKYLQENYDIPLFTWIADDEYTGLLKNKAYKQISNLNYILRSSSLVKGCSEQICDYYNSIFDCKATPLYKSCDLSTPVKEKKDKSIRIVYAGNLLYGRLEIICKISDLLERYSQNGNEYCLDIYSNTALLDSEIKKYFENKKHTNYIGKREYELIKDSLSRADLVLHVESFEESQIIKTKYSFSTKIIDYMQSGSTVLAIGPKTIASMDYLSHIPGVYIIDNLENLNVELSKVLEDREYFYERAQKTRDFAKMYHDSSVIGSGLKAELCQISTGGV